MTLLPCISKSPSFISLRYATTLESSTSDTSGGVSWVSRDTFHKGIDDNDLLQHAIHVDLINARSTPSRFTTLEEYQASHIIPYAHENAIEVIVHSRPHNDEDVTDLTLNDVRNGILVTQTIHSYLESRRVAFLKTPNPVLNTEDIRINSDRHISAGTGYPEGERFTLQLIEITEAASRPIVEQWCQVGRDAAFSTSTDTAKLSGLVLHYIYGAAAVKWWGHHTDILRSQNPPHPTPPPRRRSRSPHRHSSAAGPSTLPLYLRPRPTKVNNRIDATRKRHGEEHSTDEPPPTTHDGNIASKKHKQHSTNERVDESKAWESWDEDDWMLFCRLNTKAVHERLQAAGEESSSDIRAWAQEVSDYQPTEL